MIVPTTILTKQPKSETGRKKQKISPEKFHEVTPSDRKTLDRAKERISTSIQHRDNSLSELESAQNALERARKKLETSQLEVLAANDAVEANIFRYAEDMLIKNFHKKRKHPNDPDQWQSL